MHTTTSTHPRARLTALLLLPLLACGDSSAGTDTDGITSAQPSSGDASATSGDASATTSDETASTTGDPSGPTSGDPSASSDPTGETTAGETSDGTTSDTGTFGGCQGGIDPAFVECQDEYANVEFGWTKVERWDDPRPDIPEMDYPLDGRGDVGGQRLTFFDNVAQPPSSQFLLYYAPGWDGPADDTPVLLVHGANDSPDRAWANPNESGAYGCGDVACPETGMMQALSDAGHRVFAIGLGHRQGDNRIAAQLIRDAIAIVKDRTGADKVDLLGWSMGAFSARMYTSSVGGPWSDPYQDDVRRLILIGGPNHGFDYIFRYGINHNTLIYPECAEPLMVAPINAPSPHTSSMCFGMVYDHPELSINEVESGDFYPGQKQMLFRWDDVYDIPVTNQDWYTTYHGGDGFVSSGLGIDVAMGQGSLVQEILDAGVPASVQTYLLCGDTMGDDANEIPVIPNEVSGPSDGVVFIESCADETGIGAVADSALIVQNHLKLGWHPEAVALIESWLGG
ncbi:MAG: alpha/beta fold hydrolase [Myxococcales bacterium]|nr:alpha/beta fold hydrolase [Myxococcales bacterium]MCB9749110.1 alpha/beta fold hydrolase [Myxococcales bacterium]